MLGLARLIVIRVGVLGVVSDVSQVVVVPHVSIQHDPSRVTKESVVSFSVYEAEDEIFEINSNRNIDSTTNTRVNRRTRRERTGTRKQY